MPYTAKPKPYKDPRVAAEEALKGKTPSQLAVENRMRKVNARVRMVKLELSEEEKAERWGYNLRQKARSIVRGLRELKAMERARANSKRTKGALKSNRGLYIEDANITAQRSRLVLDSGSVPIGYGYFDPGKQGEPGRFIQDGGPEDFLGPERRSKIDPDSWVGGPEDLGPFCFGDSFVRHGKGRPEGADISQRAYLGRVPLHERDKDARGVGIPAARGNTVHPRECGCSKCKYR